MEASHFEASILRLWVRAIMNAGRKFVPAVFCRVFHKFVNRDELPAVLHELRQSDAQAFNGVLSVSAAIMHEHDIAGRDPHKLCRDAARLRPLPIGGVDVPANVGNHEVFHIAPYFGREVASGRAHHEAWLLSGGVFDCLKAFRDFFALLFGAHMKGSRFGRRRRVVHV